MCGGGKAQPTLGMWGEGGAEGGGAGISVWGFVQLSGTLKGLESQLVNCNTLKFKQSFRSKSWRHRNHLFFLKCGGSTLTGKYHLSVTQIPYHTVIFWAVG